MLSRFSLRLGQLLSLTVCLLALGRPTLCPAANGWWNQNLKCVGSLANLPGEAIDIEVVGNRVYLLCKTSTSGDVPSQNSGYLAVINIQNPTAPKLIATWTPDGNYSDMAVKDDVVYLTGRNAAKKSQLTIVDLKNPQTPRVLSRFQGISNPGTVCLEGTKLYLEQYLSDTLGELAIIDVTNPQSPRILGTYRHISTSYYSIISHVKVVKDRAFLSFYRGEIRVINIANPQNITDVGTLQFFSYGECDIGVDGSTLYGSTEFGLNLIDWTKPSTQSEITNFITPVDGMNPRMEVSQAKAFIAGGNKGICVIDLANPESNDYIKAYYFTPGAANALKVVGNRVYVATGARGLTILEFSDDTAKKKY